MKGPDRQIEKKKSHFANLVCVALTDGRIDERELELLRKLGGRIGLVDEEISGVLTRPDKVKFIKPNTPKLRLRQLVEVVMIVLADGRIDLAEHRLCTSIARKLEFDPNIAIPRIAALLQAHGGEDLEINLDQLLSELNALSNLVSTAAPTRLPPRHQPSHRPNVAGIVIIVVVILAAAWPVLKNWIDRQTEKSNLREHIQLTEAADQDLRARNWSEARRKYAEINRFYRENQRPNHYQETRANNLLKRAIGSLGEARHTPELTDKHRAKLIGDAEQDIRDAITLNPRIRFSDLRDLYQTFRVTPPEDTESRFLAMRLRIAPEVYLKNRQSLLRQGIIDVDINEAGRASIRIDYNQEGMTIDDRSSRTDHTSIASLETEVEETTSRILRETIEFIEESTGIHLLEKVRISCYHGVQSVSNEIKRKTLIDAYNRGGIDSIINVSDGSHQAIMIYQTTTRFSDAGQTRSTRVTLNRIPGLSIKTEIIPGIRPGR